MTNLSIEELRERYSREWDRTERLEDKAKNVISTAGILTSIVFGFITLSTSIFKFDFPFHLALAIGTSVVASILSILVSVLALRVQEYLSTFYPPELESNRNNLQQAKDEDLVKTVVNNYIDTIKTNYNVNNRKALAVGCATWLLFASIVLIGIATGITLSLFPTKPAAPTLTIPSGASIQGHSAYEPDPITAIRGDRIVVQNKDSFIHTASTGKGPDDPAFGKIFDTGIIKPGESAEVSIPNIQPGEYPFFCSVHPYMKGTLKVITLATIKWSTVR